MNVTLVAISACFLTSVVTNLGCTSVKNMYISSLYFKVPFFISCGWKLFWKCWTSHLYNSLNTSLITNIVTAPTKIVLVLYNLIDIIIFVCISVVIPFYIHSATMFLSRTPNHLTQLKNFIKNTRERFCFIQGRNCIMPVVVVSLQIWTNRESWRI